MHKAILLLALVPLLALALLSGAGRPATTHAQSADATALQLRGSLLLLRTADAVLERAIPTELCIPAELCRGSVLGLRAPLLLVRTADAILERAIPTEPCIPAELCRGSVLGLRASLLLVRTADAILERAIPNDSCIPGDPCSDPRIPALLNDIKTQANHIIGTANQSPGDPVIPALLSQIKTAAGDVVTTADQWLALLGGGGVPGD